VHITHSYVGAAQGPYRCQFFLLYKDYLDPETEFAREFERELERFARALGQDGAVLKPFNGDIETTKSHVLAKRWSKEHEEALLKTPSLLMIDTGFDAFDPQSNRWVLFSLGSGGWHHTIASDASQLRSLFEKIAAAVQDDKIDPFDVAREAINSATLKGTSEIFSLKPGVFGMSVDLRAAGKKLKNLYRQSKNSSHDA
jgi:hypothetical protein